MKKWIVCMGLILVSLSTIAKSAIGKVDPPCWFTGMTDPELQLMVYGQGIGKAEVALNYPGVKLERTVRLDSENYLLVYLLIGKEAQPGKMLITFTLDGKKNTVPYELKARAKKGSEHKGFDASDALYLLMPDRFANGNTKNDNVKGMAPYKVDRNDPNARHGGDLAGIAQHLDYFTDLGVTALWFTPVLENNMEGGSYHGYATTDYYKVDPRFGTNEEYRALIASAHQKGLKVVMDMIFNHCGSNHPWLLDMPSKDWFNHPEAREHFVGTSFKLTPHVDPYASKYDFSQMNDGWFVPSMPDLNQRNPYVMKYLQQSSFWWIEYADIDGIRMDTYPYADYDAMSRWMQALNTEYPNFNTVGETWVTEPAYTAWWQKDSKLSAPRNSNLKSVMDFSFYDKLNTAKNEQTETWFKGLDRVYNSFVYDFLYPNPLSVLAFFENHDTDRFLGDGHNLPMLEQAITLLLTTRRIPQLYYGTEIMMNGVKEKSDGYVRKDFPGGWAGEKLDAFDEDARTDEQNECFHYYKHLLHWRQNNPVIAKGNMIQFMVENGVYAYARMYEEHTVLVLLNGTDAATEVSPDIYKEVLGTTKYARDIISGDEVQLDKTLKFASRQSMVLELMKKP